jgi:hypothetical protein
LCVEMLSITHFMLSQQSIHLSIYLSAPLVVIAVDSRQ